MRSFETKNMGATIIGNSIDNNSQSLGLFISLNLLCKHSKFY
jgi:hypothetical protein